MHTIHIKICKIILQIDDSPFISYNVGVGERSKKELICMLTQCQINEISNVLACKARRLFGDKLKETILFGSCARGDASDGSDIDIMFLVDMGREELNNYKNSICKISSDIGMQFDILISPVLQSIAEFNEFKDDLPFFRNVLLEGVRVSAE
jgi:predicted nucleotidyltransferase